MDDFYTVTRAELVKAFKQWCVEFQRDPNVFQGGLLTEDPDAYAESATGDLLRYLGKA